MLAEAAVTWPEACVSIVGIIAFVSWWLGVWPWQKIVIHKCDCDHEEDEDAED